MKNYVTRRGFVSILGVGAASLFSAMMLGGCDGKDKSGNSGSEQNVEASDNANVVTANSPEDTTQQAADAATGGVSAVVCFSATGTTMAEAEKIAKQLGAAVDEIVPAEPYTDADLDYNSDCRANVECNDPNARPAIVSARTNLDGIDTVYIGYPIWWGDAAPIMRTYIESIDLEGKRVVPFCTSGGSGISSSVSTLQSLSNGGNWTSGLRLTGSDAQIEQLLAR